MELGNNIEDIKHGEKSLDQKKRVYFSHLALGALSAMRLHKTPGNLWERKDGKRDWGNVSEHCLTELARVGVLAKKLGLPEAVKRNLEIAAALHDFGKRNEIMAMKNAIQRGERPGKASDDVDATSERQMREAGFDDEAISIAGFAVPKPLQLFAIAEILGKKELTDHEIALLIMHYVDGYTQGSGWAGTTETRPDGKIVNDVDRRIEKALANDDYQKTAEDLIAPFKDHLIFKNTNLHEAARTICHAVGKRLVAIMQSRTGETVQPVDLPEIVDREIKREIEETI